MIDPSRWWSPLFPVLRLLSGPLLSALVAAILSWYGHAFPVLVAAGVVMWCAAWWVLEPVPIAVTALIPLGVFPATGVLTSSQVAESVGHRLVLLFMGGLMLSMAMERSGAHRRIALAMVRWFGGRHGGANPKRVVFGFMAAAAALSMWISNGATTLMMLPIALAVVEHSRSERLPVSLLLGIAFAASVGGTGTPIGTPPNLIFIDNYVLVGGEEPSFVRWATWTWPIIAVMLPIQALWLTRSLPSRERLELPEVGRWRVEEIRTLVVFFVTALLWVTRTGPFGGWSSWLGAPGANDATVAIAAVIGRASCRERVCQYV